MSPKFKTATRSLRCQVCKHPERTRIELMRASGVSLDVIASKFNVGRDAVNRHWHGHVSDQMKASFLAGPLQLEELAQKAAETGASVLDHLHAIRVVLFSHLATATEAGDGALAANVAGRLTHVLETIARISGELGALATNTTYNITNNVAVLAESPAFLKVQASLLHALAPYPEARAAVVAALNALDEGAPAPALPAPPKEVIDAEFTPTE
jgi:hypothetical protein